MTGGQMAPTTLLGQKTTTSPLGRDAQTTGYPMKVSEMLSALGSEGYIERVTVGQPKYIPAAKKAIRKAIQNQLDGKGFSMVEVLSTCPTNWGMHAPEAGNWLPLPASGRFQIRLRLYDTPISSQTGETRAGNLPRITRVDCR